MKHKKIQFKTAQQEHDYWAKTDVTDVFDMNAAVVNPPLPKLKPSTGMVSIRLPKAMVEDLKSLANKRDVPYQSLLKVFLSEKIQETFRHATRALPSTSLRINSGGHKIP